MKKPSMYVESNAVSGDFIRLPDESLVEVGMAMSAGTEFEIIDGKALPIYWREVLAERASIH